MSTSLLVPTVASHTVDPLLAWRKEFPILEHTTYMISHSLGPMPRRAAAALLEFTNTWATRGIRAWAEGWWEMPVTCGDLIGSIIGAPKGRVVMHQNVSICQSIVTLLLRLERSAQQACNRWSQFSLERLHLSWSREAGRGDRLCLLRRRHDRFARSHY